MSQYCRSMSVWSGGYFFIAALLSDDRAVVARTERWALQFWSRLVAYTQAMNDNPPRELIEFDSNDVWYHHDLLWRVLCYINVHGVTETLITKLSYVYGTIVHERFETIKI